MLIAGLAWADVVEAAGNKATLSTSGKQRPYIISEVANLCQPGAYVYLMLGTSPSL